MPPGSAPIERFVDQMSAFLQHKNQFIVLGAQERADLAALYVDFLADFQGMLLARPSEHRLAVYLEHVLADHQHDLEYFVASWPATSAPASSLASRCAANIPPSYSFIFCTPASITWPSRSWTWAAVRMPTWSAP